MVSDFKKKEKAEASNIIFQASAIVAIIIVLVLVVANIRLYQRKKELARQISNYTQEIKKFEQDNAKLNEEIANADNLEYIEKVAREENNMQKPGEKVVSFIMPKEDKNSVETEQKNWLANFWQGIVSIFK